MPITIGRFIIKGDWDTSPDPPNTIPILLKPIDHRFVYGFGWNASTQGMLRALECLDVKGKTVLDVGTGTGILAIAAAKMGAKVYAVDTDQDAMDYAQDVAKLNGVEIIFAEPDNPDIILGNLNDAEWLAGRNLQKGQVVIATLPEESQFLTAVATQLSVNTEIVGPWYERYSVATIRRL